jgi:flagellum-specific ATP synthase
MAAYAEKEDLIAVGAYEEGTNPEVDASIALRPELNRYLRQEPNERTGWEESLGGLLRLAGRDDGRRRRTE